MRNPAREARQPATRRGPPPGQSRTAAAARRLAHERFPGIAALQARLGMPLVVADFEMNGYNDQPRVRIIEFAAIEFDADGRGTIDHSLIGSTIPVFWPATKKTGLRTADLAGAPPWENYAPRFQRLTQHGALALFAAAFDVIALTEEQARLGLPIDAPTVLDVQSLARAALGVPQAPSLGRACEAFDVAFEGDAHRADADTIATARLLERLIELQGVEAAAALVAPRTGFYKVAPDETARALLLSPEGRAMSPQALGLRLATPPARIRAWQAELGIAAEPAPERPARRPRPRRRAAGNAGADRPGRQVPPTAA